MSAPVANFQQHRLASFEDLADLLKVGYTDGFSDFHLRPGRPVLAKKHGKILQIPGTDLTKADLEQLIDHPRMYGASGVSELAQGKAPNTAVQVRVDRGEEIRFRVQTKACRGGYHIAFRVIQSEPAHLDKLEIEQELIENCMPPDGMVLLCGPTGSGKTTLLSAIHRALVEPEDANRVVLTYEDPIEYVYDSVAMPSSDIIQVEIPTHLASYADAIPSAMRSDPDVITINEMKDLPTIAAACDAAMTGHALYATGHAKSVAAAISRFVNIFPPEERQGRSVDLLQSLHLVVAQRLIPRIGGGMVGLREWLVFNDDIKDKLLKIDPTKWPGMVSDLVKTDGRPMLDALTVALRKDQITERQFSMMSAREGGVA